MTWKIINWSNWVYNRTIGKRHKMIPIPWACPLFPLANFTVASVGTNIEKCDMQFVTSIFTPPYL